MVFRITKGNVYQTNQEIIKVVDDFESDRNVSSFIIVYQSGENQMVKLKINKLCESFGAKRY
jgi:hypothetical protein